jgi:ketosteroid isomerase-like protein
MSQENVELLSELVPPGVDQVQLFGSDELWAQWVESKGRLFHPDFQSSITLLGGEHTRSGGVNAFRAFFLDWLAPWATYWTESEDLVDCGDQVLVILRDAGRLQGGTHEVKRINAAVVTVRDGQAIRQRAYLDPTEALKAVGLEE